MEPERSSNPIDVLLHSSKDLFTPENIVADVAMDLIKGEVKKHLEKKIAQDPALAKEFKEAVMELMEARALEYSALLRVTVAVTKLGLISVPEEMKMKLAKDLASLMGREIASVMEKTL